MFRFGKKQAKQRKQRCKKDVSGLGWKENREKRSFKDENIEDK